MHMYIIFGELYKHICMHMYIIFCERVFIAGVDEQYMYTFGQRRACIYLESVFLFGEWCASIHTCMYTHEHT